MLFMAAGLALLAVTYLLFNQQLSQSFASRFDTSDGRRTKLSVIAPGGYVMQGPEALDWMQTQETALREAAVTSLLAQGIIALVAVGLSAVVLCWVVTGRMLAPCAW
ncbi:hypothetical protein ACFQ0B_56370 [Nonomuraea thailandensis]